MDDKFIKDNRLTGWNKSIERLHSSNEAKNNKSNSFRRIVFDEIFANFLTLSKNRKRIKKGKKSKNFKELLSKRIIYMLPYKLTEDQKSIN